MTISKDTARLTARVIIDAIEEYRDESTYLVALAVIESLQAVEGNKSFQESLKLIHREIKEIHLSGKP